MTNRFWAGVLAGASLLALSAPAHADKLRTLTMTFQSGAQFDGTVSFTDDYSALTGVSGTLSKYSFSTGYTGSDSDSDSFNWVWAFGTNYASGTGNYADWLMDGPGSGYNSYGSPFSYILLAYNYSNAPTLSFTTGATSYGDNYINYNDPMVSGSFGPEAVPEPTSWALMLGGFGAIGGALRSRRKAAVSFA